MDRWIKNILNSFLNSFLLYIYIYINSSSGGMDRWIEGEKKQTADMEKGGMDRWIGGEKKERGKCEVVPVVLGLKTKNRKEGKTVNRGMS